ncbi:MAG TPA: sugar ABC transporter permease [Bacilli bacterium]
MNLAIAESLPELKQQRKKETRKRILRNKWMYLMILPGLLYFIVFKYIPMYGLIIAFQEYKPYLGVLKSDWVGFAQFHRLFNDPWFWTITKNTLVLFVLNITIYFPIPIILALMLNEVRVQIFKRTIQSIVYLPYFMSWVIVVSISFVLLSVDNGIVNNLLAEAGYEKINFFLDPRWFRPMYILQNIWREAGWGTIIYLAAMAGVDPQLYEAAHMDGAGRFKQMWHITLPSIRNVIVIMLLLRMGNVLEVGFEHVYLLLNAMNRHVGEIYDTYMYTVGLLQQQFSYTTAVGFFRSAVGLILVVVANWLAKLFKEEGIF